MKRCLEFQEKSTLQNNCFIKYRRISTLCVHTYYFLAEIKKLSDNFLLWLFAYLPITSKLIIFLNRLKNTKYLSKVIINDKQMIMMNKQAAEYVGSLIAVLIKDQK
jgi:hypothetical protein